MFLKKTKSNNKTYLLFVEGYRIDGKVKQRTVEKIGYLEKFEKIYDDPIAHFKQIAKNRTEKNDSLKSIEVNLSTKLDDNTNNRRNLGYVIPKTVYSSLKFREFFQSKQRHLDIEYNLNSIFSMLVFN